MESKSDREIKQLIDRKRLESEALKKILTAIEARRAANGKQQKKDN
ncbi:MULTISPECIES: hypothetical protein [unclassified Carboxylicivirga]